MVTTRDSPEEPGHHGFLGRRARSRGAVRRLALVPIRAPPLHAADARDRSFRKSARAECADAKQTADGGVDADRARVSGDGAVEVPAVFKRRPHFDDESGRPVITLPVDASRVASEVTDCIPWRRRWCVGMGGCRRVGIRPSMPGWVCWRSGWRR